MQDARASRLREINLDVTPTSFSSVTTNRHELSRYILDVPDINDHEFDGNNKEEDDENDDEVITGLEVDTVLSRLCLSDLQGLG